MFSKFKKASVLLQIFLLLAANAIVNIFYAGNWFAGGVKNWGFALVITFLAFMAGNAGITEGQSYTLKPANKARLIAALATIGIAIAVAAIKAYNLTQ